MMTYNVRDGFWDEGERRFGGFLGSVQTAEGDTPAETLVTEVTYLAGLGEDRVLRGRPVSSEQRDGTGRVFDRTVSTWTAVAVTDAAPAAGDARFNRVPFLKDTTREVYEATPDSTPVSTRSTFVADAYGRTTGEKHEGRLDLTGDEKSVARNFASDDDTWVRNVVCEESLFDGETALRTSRTIYGDDTGPAPAQPGQPCGVGKGWTLATEGWLSNPGPGGIGNRWVTQSAADYDSLGNVIASYADGVWRRLQYDDNGLYVVGETLFPRHADGDPNVRPPPATASADESLGGDDTSGQTAARLQWTATWDNHLGVVTSATSPDGVRQHVTYDSLARPIALNFAGHAPHVRYGYDWTAPLATTASQFYDGPVGDLKIQATAAITVQPMSAADLTAPWGPSGGWSWPRKTVPARRSRRSSGWRTGGLSRGAMCATPGAW